MKKQYFHKSKNEGALSKRFLRHRGIYRSDVSSLLVNLGQSAAVRSVPGQAIGRAGRYTPCPSSAMSSGRLFLDGVLASIAHLRFTGTTRLKPLPHRKKQFIIERYTVS
jgi:hypothetical protein